ncbi:hypothetical protein, conserved [Angomonas deanei]|uniref:Uncharacterized protein n=1 Tax=Angomonas deanei TaxID=59799 RepID=A0A7G2CSE7_9TRYP|nr:hypothetical protein, conserved [Angomonas deanei]
MLLEQSAFGNVLLPSLLTIGVPVVVRLFGYQLPREWEPFFNYHNNENKAQNLLQSSLSLPTDENSKHLNINKENRLPLEFFRVERFIPISMQMEADGKHIYDFRPQNKIEGIAFVASEVDSAMFENIMETNHKNNKDDYFNLYLLDEVGVVKEVNHDQRKGDGGA